jgi:hypothetical protein
MIVVGCGEAVENLAKRRMAVGGRLCVVELSASAEVIETKLLQEDSHLGIWQPPPSASRSELAARLGARPERRRIKMGPDVVSLAENEKLEILTMHGQHVGVRVTAGSTEVVWEMNGFVILRPSEADAASVKVDIVDPDAMTFMIPELKQLWLCMAIALVMYTALMIFSLSFEKDASLGQVPWWRMLWWVPLVVLGTGASAVPHFAKTLSGYMPGRTFVFFGVAISILTCIACVSLKASGFLSSFVPCLPSLYLALF